MNMAVPDDEVDGFLSPKEERDWEEAKKGKAHLPKFVLPLPFDGMMKDTKSSISSLILYVYGRKAKFLNNESKIMFALSYMQGAIQDRNGTLGGITSSHALGKGFFI